MLKDRITRRYLEERARLVQQFEADRSHARRRALRMAHTNDTEAMLWYNTKIRELEHNLSQDFIEARRFLERG